MALWREGRLDEALRQNKRALDIIAELHGRPIQRRPGEGLRAARQNPRGLRRRELRAVFNAAQDGCP
ncbi:hypothetical protein Pth03_33430 [Planotetraspora thailandica]|uniref:Tetratricopeptide repeat protein n=1 Tax=Planotetraspora thailandica TaxID=487172 RepID=A0A8J3UZJ2_9ACTN|nr:hypothetical protein Pth03_33430 [Planotetraspora thailandica]